jgi:CDP-diacylglycerol--glycerol-3-phosphate 3-phosphatidyltransferase
MNLPNALTLARIFLVPLLVAAFVQDSWQLSVAGFVLTNDLLALCIFLAAAATDLLDGYVARRWEKITTVGTLLDPIADKLLISAALISLVEVRSIPGWMAILIIAREFAVSGLRSIAASAGYTIKANDLGKTKMVFQVIAVSLALLARRFAELQTYAMLTMWVVIFFAIASAISYFTKFWGRVDETVKARRRKELLMAKRRQRKLAAAAAVPVLSREL